MSLILSHPTGNEFVRATAKALVDSGMLMEFHTSIATFPNSILSHLGSIKTLAELHRRRYNPVLKPYTHQWPWREVGRHVATRSGFDALIKHEVGPLSVDGVYRDMDRRVASRLVKAAQQGAEAVYAYEDGALQSFQRAKQTGLTCLYDLPIGYWKTARRLLTTEQERWPAWASTITGFLDSAEKLARKDAEIGLADQIFVASSFTAQTLQDYPGTLPPVHVVPYGYPPVDTTRTYRSDAGQRRLRVLFVGGLSQRKGIADLFEAVDSFGKHVELTVVGRKTTAICPALDLALSKHRWIPSLPHAEILQIMRQNDVLVFPSLFEGFGLVITEAMSQGTPVITTERTAGPDLIRQDENGWLTKAGNVDSIREAIEKLLNKPELVVSVGREALDSARKRPWSVYGKEMATLIRESVFKPHSHQI